MVKFNKAFSLETTKKKQKKRNNINNNKHEATNDERERERTTEEKKNKFHGIFLDFLLKQYCFVYEFAI